jgi:myosin heavy subunit
MITKICLFLAILASAGTLYLTHVQVDEKIKGLNTKIETTEGEKNTLQGEKTKLASDLSKEKTAKDELSNKLAAATKEADAAVARADAAQKETDKAKKETDDAKKQIVIAQQSAADLVALKKSAAEIKKAFADLATKTTQLDEATRVNKSMTTQLTKVQAELKTFTEMSKPGPAMPGLKGVVMSVDPKWGFVVIDAGVERGALASGELSVNRSGQLIARLRITKVEKTHSIANIIQGTSKGDILEGDQVLY